VIPASRPTPAFCTISRSSKAGALAQFNPMQAGFPFLSGRSTCTRFAVDLQKNYSFSKID
jgi:hypothetical protein